MLLQSEVETLPYIARVEYLLEHPSSLEPMMTCRWFYRSVDVPGKLFDKTVKGARGSQWSIRKGSGRVRQVLPNEVFMSNFTDENAIATVVQSGRRAQER